MVEDSKSPKKVPITEQDSTNLLLRYPPETILTALQEIHQNTNGTKINWNALVRNTNTGITNAREYQMLWRNLAYGHDLCDDIEDDDSPLDDDSDLEIERDPFPSVGREVASEAAACVKVLMASGCHNDSDGPGNSTIEAPLTINIPNIKALNLSSSSLHENGIPSMNITIPVYVQKQPLASGTSTGEKRPVVEPSSGPKKKKTKPNCWSTEEETKLTAAVQKHGEQNWANISSADFKNDRKPSELSQKWSTLKKSKKQSNSKVGSNSQLSESQLAAAHRAVTMAIDGGDNMLASHVGIAGTKLPHNQPQKASTLPPEHHQLGGRSSSVKAAAAAPPPPTPVGPDPMIKAAALAAGARIATSAHVASLKEAARSQNIVHIKTGGSGGGPVKTGGSGGGPVKTGGSGAGQVMKSSAVPITNQLPPNVHYIGDGLAKAPISARAAAKPIITRPSVPAGSIKLAEVPVKPVSQSDRGVDGGLSVSTPAEQKDQSAKPGNVLEKS